MERGFHPFPSRTRKLSPSSPMVLHGRPCGRVGRCQILLTPEAPSRATRGFFYAPRLPAIPRKRAGSPSGRGRLGIRFRGSASETQPIGVAAAPRRFRGSAPEIQPIEVAAPRRFRGIASEIQPIGVAAASRRFRGIASETPPTEDSRGVAPIPRNRVRNPPDRGSRGAAIPRKRTQTHPVGGRAARRFRGSAPLRTAVCGASAPVRPAPREPRPVSSPR